ncbi:PepSY-associated TM helix domain-containing protein [Archangium lipolyticum]|uniref:PepSY-associated TM helix domain-containing protein n=1 Tax=Archangium lipolyticum TaxID=2970465 RepID=UPI00214A688A|nr:PepSY-associated TM helix domain-containing protein [Archangium lipolyticum]
MSRTFRNILFWLHLVSGVIAGVVIAIMSFTGAAIAFKPQILAWAESEVRRVQPPTPDAPRLPVDELVARVRAARPEAQPSGVTVYPEPGSTVMVSLGRTGVAYVNPYSGEVLPAGDGGWRGFFHVMEEWHRWLGAKGDNTPVGKAITGACNAAFLFLAISGLYLWWPRKWTWRTVRPSLWFRRDVRGKARDWNWHNVIGFWSLPVLVILTASGMVISYRWASNLIFTLAGEKPPAAQGPAAPPSVTVPEPPAGAKPLGFDALLARAQQQVPAHESVTLRLGGGGGGGRPPGPQGAQGAQGAQGPRGEQGPQRGGGPGGNEARAKGPQPVTFAIREQGAWPLFASAQLVFDPFTGEVLRREGFADYTPGRQMRTWMRFLHTGEALGWGGQLLAAIASLGGVLLVWTGFSLSWRRFFPRRKPAASSTGAEPSGSAESEVVG